MNGKLDPEERVLESKEIQHSKYWYDYNRNDLNRKNPFEKEIEIEFGSSYERDIDQLLLNDTTNK